MNMQEALTFNHGYEHKTEKLLLNNAFILRFLTLHERLVFGPEYSHTHL